MLKTNSKQARENVKRYILESTLNWEEKPFKSFNDVSRFIFNDFERVFSNDLKNPYRKESDCELFIKYSQGLPLYGGVFDYWLYSGIDTLGAILEESEEEKNKYAEDKAENFITYLIYREITKALNK